MGNSQRLRIFFNLTLMMLIMVTAMTFFLPANAAPEKPPFIYYYSQDKSVFIIERADGSESRILAPYTLHPTPGVDEDVIGPGWSPSGRWFAWSSTLEAGTGEPHNVFVVKREG